MRAAVIACAFALVATEAHAFHEISSYSRTANTGGGAGYYFTGSPRFKGYDCAICHTEAEGRISIQLSSDPPDLASGTYTPGALYTIDLVMLGEHRGLESAFNPNTFALEIADGAGGPVGILLTTPNDIVRISDGGRVALAEGFGNGETEWTVFWQAPDAAVPATVFLGALDGDGASDPDRRWIDALNDDVVVARRRLCADGIDCDRPEPPELERSAVQCNSAGSASGAPWWLLAVIAPLVALRRRCTLRRT